jgi:hypothetical protein
MSINPRLGRIYIHILLFIWIDRIVSITKLAADLIIYIHDLA